MEMEALASTLADSRAAAGLTPLYLGSGKPSVGHTEDCSGPVGVLQAMPCSYQPTTLTA